MNSTIRLPTLIAACAAAIVIVAILSPVFARPRQERGNPCLSNMKMLMFGQICYAADYDDRLPDGEKWMDETWIYCDKNEYFCPGIAGRKPGQFGYAMYYGFSRHPLPSIPNTSDVLVLFDSVVLDKNAVTGFVGFGDRHQAPCFAFADGHARAFPVSLSAQRDQVVKASISAARN